MSSTADDIATSVDKSLSRIPSIFPTMSRSTTDSDDEDVKPIFVDTVDYSQHSDPSVNTATLGDDHPIYLLQEAQLFYQGRDPPFTLRKRPELSRNVVIPTASGQRPQVPTTVEVVAKPWDDKRMFWTLDLNNVRYIVKPFGGAPQAGHKYLYWAGPSKDFDQKPLAFTELNVRPFHDTPAQPEEELSSDEDSSEDSEDENSVPEESHAGRRRITDDSSLTSGDGRDKESMAFAQRLLDLSGLTPPDSDDPIQSNKNDPNSGSKNALKKGKRPTRHSDLPRRLVGDMGEPTAFQGAPAKRRKTDISSREVARLVGASPLSLDTQRSRNQPHASISHQSMKVPDARAAQSSNSMISGLVAQPTPPTDPAVMDFSKQKRTTLIVRVAPSAEYQPLKLSECATMAIVYAKCTGMWGIAEKDVAKLTVTFTWMNASDRMRTMVINAHQEAGFAHLIEQVEDAPCWEDSKGKCFLDVDIVMK